mmetsp:Transcript_38293/g.75396  ORF Transcript_38293/g.75396 Transcript_38293/m.75396 type:complete len:348 (+) Transcript_38293:71-1114(+)
MSLTTRHVYEAAARLAQTKLLYRTPVFDCPALNRFLGGGHRIFFKCENLQRVGAFKSRGALNAVLKAVKKEEKPSQIVAYSSGNHAQAVAWACSKLGVDCTIFMPDNVSPLKAKATAAYGATVQLAPTRPVAEQWAADAVAKGALLIPPFDHDDVITGQGTACLEAIEDMTAQGVEVDCILAPVGGGGLIGGTYLAAGTSMIRHPPSIIGAEPATGNDASLSFQSGVIHQLDRQPQTMADGAMTMAVSERTFEYVKKLDDIYEVSELEIAYWTQWMTHLLKLTVEPTSSMPLAAAVRWLQKARDPQNVLCIISGGNVATDMRMRVWKENRLDSIPSLDIDWSAMPSQ